MLIFFDSLSATTMAKCREEEPEVAEEIASARETKKRVGFLSRVGVRVLINRVSLGVSRRLRSSWWNVILES